MEKYEQWDSTWSFIFAMIGCAIGLGNIWRFSYVVYSNGGGSFFIPYFVAIAIMGVPFLILEYGMGFSFKCAFTDVFKRINPKFEFIAWILIFLIAIVLIYYMVIISWDMFYLFNSFTFNWGSDPATYFVHNVGGSNNLSNIWNFLLPISVGVIITWFILWFISHKSINQGIGVASKILIPSVFVIMIIIVIYALTLPGAMIGINALLNPNWNALLDVNIWLVAFSQIIFSLGMGEAMALTYASYLSDNSKLSDNVLIVVASNSSFEIFTAFGVFSILGYMSATSGTPLAEIVSEGTGLIFVVFPKIFDLMGFMGHILAPLFFIAILFAGISSAFAFFEPIIGSISSKMNIPRKKLVTILCIIGCVCSLLLTCGISSYLVGIIDGFVNKFGILILVAIQCIIFGWYYGAEKLIPIINRQSTIKVGSLWKNIIKYILPTFIFIIWIVGIVELFVNSKAFELIIYSGIIIIVLLLSTVFYRIKD
ncbi:sodium-dependent transporter [uncultured Methanobrevibacter sp.]|uniref:sodium-dependent transporter n=1 Tax=uncultured Methanobrevibacter sp. TaxID=253161 RepID=UPI0025DEEE8A|nr:sodium-dependent transporter [uncultured Methanobrevibacter sp.]